MVPETGLIVAPGVKVNSGASAVISALPGRSINCTALLVISGSDLSAPSGRMHCSISASLLSGSFFMQLVRLKQINPRRQNVRILFRISSVLIIPVHPVELVLSPLPNCLIVVEEMFCLYYTRLNGSLFKMLRCLYGVACLGIPDDVCYVLILCIVIVVSDQVILFV